MYTLGVVCIGEWSTEMNSIWSDGGWYYNCKLSRVKLKWFKEDSMCWCWPIFCFFFVVFYERSLKVVTTDYTWCSIQGFFLCFMFQLIIIWFINRSLLFDCVLVQVSLFIFTIINLCIFVLHNIYILFSGVIECLWQSSCCTVFLGVWGRTVTSSTDQYYALLKKH